MRTGFVLGFSLRTVAQLVKNLPAMVETRIWSLYRKDALKGVATHPSILA